MMGGERGFGGMGLFGGGKSSIGDSDDMGGGYFVRHGIGMEIRLYTNF